MLCRNCATRDDGGRVTEFGHHDTVDEARVCSGVSDPRATTKARTFIRNGIREGGLLSDHFTVDGLRHICEVFGLSTSGTKEDLRLRVKEVL